MNKFVESFKKSVKTLLEDDGNPSILQAIDYDIDNEEMRNDPDIGKVQTLLTDAWTLLNQINEKYQNNKKLQKIQYDFETFLDTFSEEWNKDLDSNSYRNELSVPSSELGVNNYIYRNDLSNADDPKANWHSYDDGRSPDYKYNRNGERM